MKAICSEVEDLRKKLAVNRTWWKRLAEATDPADFGCYEADTPAQVFEAIRKYAQAVLDTPLVTPEKTSREPS